MKKNVFFLLIFMLFTSCMQQGFVTGSQIVEEEEPEITQAELTLMIYMAADNDLEAYALQNLNDIKVADCYKVKVVVLLDRSEGYDETDGNWTDTRLFEAGNNELKQLDCPRLGLSCSTQTELDMSNNRVLKSFIEFSRETYPAQRYALIMWGHGTGRAVAIDDKTQSFMSVHNLYLALKDAELSVIGFDTCFGGTIETVYELKSCAAYTVGSAGLTLCTGWNYTGLLKALEECPFDSDCCNCQIAKSMADVCVSGATVFENARLDSMVLALEDFAKELANTVTDSVSQKSVYDALLNCRSYSHNQYPCDMFLDIYSMAQLYAKSSVASLALAAGGLMEQTEGLAASIHFIPKLSYSTTTVTHSLAYIKDESQTDQCAFVKESLWWVPTINGNSGSLLDKLFYTVF
ncbi:MAG: hypothetical protein J5726_03135 [Treponema sp.]|nr:hypothetical protein [Treponema sp.]